jgi:amino acid adenylation domain-containing protein
LLDAGVEVWLEGERVRFRAPQGRMSQPWLERLQQHREAVRAALRAKGEASRTTFPLSWNQFGIWFASQSTPLVSAYHVAFAARVTSPIDLAALTHAAQALVDRHPSLRTAYTCPDGQPQQVVWGYRPAHVVVHDCSSLSDTALSRAVREAHERPFELEHPAPMRMDLFTRAQDDHVLLIGWHHIAIDGWSVWMLCDELFTLYEAMVTKQPSTLPRVVSSYPEFVRWQHDFVQSAAGEQLWRYWRDKLADVQPLTLPLDRAPGTTDVRAGSCSWHLPADDFTRLKALASGERTSVFVVLLAMLKVLLFRYTGQPDVVVGTPTFGRSRPEFEDLAGVLINAVPVRTDLAGSPSFRETVARVRDSVLGALEHADYPFPLLVQRLGLRSQSGRSPLLDVMVAYHTPQRARNITSAMIAGGAYQTPGGTLRLEGFPFDQQEGLADLSMAVIEAGEELHGTFTYRADVLDQSTVSRIGRHLTGLLRSVALRPDQSIDRVELLSEDEQRTLASDWNGAGTISAASPTIHSAFERQAALSPDVIAVVDGSSQLTYAQLDKRATTIAHHLVRRGAGPGARIGIATERSVNTVAALLGVLKAGAAYVPLDPRYPSDRLAHMVRDSEACFVITERSLPGATGGESPQSIVFLEDCMAASHVADVPLPSPDPDSAAYVIYTSGSTGRPKGVVVPHRAVAALLAAIHDRFGTSAADKWVALTTLSFDPSVMEIFGPLSCGARVLVVSAADMHDGTRLAELIDEWQPTVLRATPTAWRMLLDAGWRGSPALTILSGGEPLTKELAAALCARGKRLFNVYGPTETTIWATAAEVVDPTATVTIGRPFPHVRTYVLDPHRQLVPVGVPGELYIGGAAVALGYHNQTALTAERFLTDPFSSEPDARMYRTGDRVRWRPNGELEYLGRLDDQLKVRGHRVEPGEIEAALERHPSVRRAVVVSDPAAPLEQLLAFVECITEVGAGDLRRFLRDTLPEFMVPSHFQIVPELPVTPNGKVDRLRLPSVEIDRVRVIEPARTTIEAELVSVWEELLEVRPIGVHDNFFDLGGHSLLATRMCGRLSTIAGRRVHVAEFFQAPTIAEQAVRFTGPARDTGFLVPLRSHASGVPFFCLPGAADNPFIFADIARHLSSERPVFSFRYSDNLGSPLPPLREAITLVARRFIDDMRTVHPHGPYLLGGYCGGAVVAFEMANQLLDAGHQVAALIVFDAFLPGGFRKADARARIAHHVEYFRAISWPERLTFVARQTGNRLMRLGRRVSPRLGKAAATLATNDDYTPRRVYPGQLTLFRATVQEPGLVFDNEMGWGGLADRVIVHDIEGDHLDVYKEPNVSQWIETLRTVLASSEAPYASTSSSPERINALGRSA